MKNTTTFELTRRDVAEILLKHSGYSPDQVSFKVDDVQMDVRYRNDYDEYDVLLRVEIKYEVET